MLGSYSFNNGILTFKPRFGVSRGIQVRAVYQQPGADPIEKEFRQAAPSVRSTTFVEQVYPSSDSLPANLLRFYIQFSAPMQRGMAWQHIRLLNNAGRPLELPFLELDQELWDQESKRLTVLFDPGRIKRGVLPREEVGSALIAGSSYTLAIDEAWRDAQGAPLQRGFKKQFTSSAEARQGIDLEISWRAEELVRRIEKRRELARLLEPKRLRLTYADTPLQDAVKEFDQLKGKVVLRSLSEDQPVKEKEPKTKSAGDSKAGRHRLQVDTALEDVAGNRVGRPFDVDTFAPVTKTITRKYESLPFRIRS